ncbi:MAG TPA: thiamine pyrophosphate-dependent enzyme [Bacteroidales bacterium]|jgi:2-oxoisovalerate dehydrogenase E1 component|nr:MAG: 2-oxoisovalerate dehydrogenase subunit beta [Bacteroidetes bacterium ADurb.Bin145]HQK67962.1 thiamine pyrophosphate-dependent enzyme [Bacteroidales bacterium]
MPKSQNINPKIVRKPQFIEFGKIPVNQYNKTIEEEKKNFSNDDLLRIYRDMVIIREFETMLNQIKTTNEYNGIAYNHPGPAHLSIGQEASAVGMAYNLGVDDYIFGSHRSHGEILAKGLSAINKLDEDILYSIMRTWFGGGTLKVVEKGFQGNITELAIHFLLYGALAEIFARENGFNKGLGGSMHAFFTPFGIYPNNAIVGGSGDISVGAALFKKINRKPGIVVCNIGDASTGCGPVWEGICFATMDQYRTLWDGEYKGGLPLIFNIMNNLYGMGGQTMGETMGYGILARLGAGVNPDMMHAERVDGYNPLAVIDAFNRKIKLLQEKKGPVLLDTLTYRISGHSPSDASSYRSKEEINEWQKEDSIVAYGNSLVSSGIAKQDHLDDIKTGTAELMMHILKLTVDDNISPRLDLIKNPDAIGEMMFSNCSIDRMEEGKPEVLMPLEENPRVRSLKTKARYYRDNDGKPVSKAKLYQLRDGIFEAIIDRFYKDPTLAAWGEENRDWGGAFAVYRGLTEALPYHRLFNSPISEGAIVGTAIGYGMCGGRVIAEIMYCDFLGRSGDEVFNQLPKWQAMSGNIIRMPVVIRVSVGSKYGAQHSQDWSSLTAHIPGLKVVFPATPYDAKGLMNSALQGTDPVIFFESQRIYDVGEMFHEGGVPEEYYEIPIGEPDIKKKGGDITILSIGATLYQVIKVADTLQQKYGISAEIIDARTLVPFNYTPVLESVKKTGKIVLASDASSRGSFLKEMAQTITELAFDYLDAPPVTVGSRNWITPAYEMEQFFFPQPEWILDAINEKIIPLKGHIVKNAFSTEKIILLNREGV